jgi:hypothetical protein
MVEFLVVLKILIHFFRKTREWLQPIKDATSAIIYGGLGPHKPLDPLWLIRKLDNIQNTIGNSYSGNLDEKLKADFLENFDGLTNNIIFCMWTGKNEMSRQRTLALWSVIINSRCPIAFISSTSIRDWELPKAPFHRAFEFLSETHKSDYLRCYLMHHYGGGYTDIKVTHKNWGSYFSMLRQCNAFGLGYTEIGPNGVAPVPGALGDKLRENYDQLIGLCAFIFRRDTEFTREWYRRTCKFLDEKYDQLKMHPAQHPQDESGLILPDGTRSRYPVGWSEMLGCIFHPIAYECREKILHQDISPQFFGYR